MANLASISLARQLGTLFERGSSAGLSDRQLLDRFTARGEEAGETAFAAIVERHGPMVLGVCRQLLSDHHYAEDAFQAVFLVLARQARSIRDPDLLGPWLYGVAFRTARKARARVARRRRTDEEGAGRQRNARPGQPADRAMLESEQAEALHREIERLPGSFRAPVVLYYLEGLTLDEAARRLRWPAGTFRSRLARARDKLRRGLVRRGFVLSATALAAGLNSRSAPASISPLLRDSTTREAMSFAVRQAGNAAVPAFAAALAQEVLQTVVLKKVKLAAISFLIVAIVAGGTMFLTRPPTLADEPKVTSAAAQTRVVKEPPDSVPRRMTVVGRVLDPDGKPVPGASVLVYGALKQADDRPGAGAPAAIGHGACDGTGQFRLDAPPMSSATHYIVGAAAVARGYGTGWVNLDVDADAPVAEITLRPEQVIVGRLFDLQGRPAAGVRVSVEGMGYPDRRPHRPPEYIEGVHFWQGHQTKSPEAWPDPAITDADGRFELRGIGQGVRVLLMADDPRFARQRIVVDTDSSAQSKSITAALEPAKVIAGRVTYADTGKPVPHAAIEIVAFRGGPGYSNQFETDADGQFRANPLSTDRYTVSVLAPAGQPYLNVTSGMIDWTKGTVEHRVDLRLQRGTVIRGKVTEKGSGRPVGGAILHYVGRPAAAGFQPSPWSGTTQSGPDGSYLLAVLPKPGTLAVLGPSEDYVFDVIGQHTLFDGQPGGQRVYAHAFVPCDLEPGIDSKEINVVLRRGTTVKAQVTGPDGRPISEAWVFSRVLCLPQPFPWRYFWGDYHGDVRGGRTELHGLAPNDMVPAYFLDAVHKVGATAAFSVRAGESGPIKVRLEPCGRATARLVDPKGKPLAGYRDPYMISMVVTPGPDRSAPAMPNDDQLAADADYLSRIDPERYADLVSDPQGRVTFPVLIPGATIRVFDNTTQNDTRQRQVRKEFVARAGETIDLGDILIENPAS
jgi:RNA polymerase sigma factor (sigma-70 family)